MNELPEEISKTSFLGLPVLARWKILNLLSPKERKVLRLVCSFLANEIDFNIGLNDVISINDKRSLEVLKFFSTIVMNGIKIRKRCFLTFGQIFSRPLAIRVLHLDSRGIIKSEFAGEILKNMQNLEILILEGFIGEAITEDCPMLFRKLQEFQFDNKYPCFFPVSKTKRVKGTLLDGLVQNQLNLLRNLQIPVCKKAVFKSRIYANRGLQSANDDGDELIASIVKFAERNPYLTCLELDVRYCRSHKQFYLPTESSYRRRTGSDMGPEVVIIPSVQRSDIRIQDVTINLITVRWVDKKTTSRSKFQREMISFLKSLTGIEYMEFNTDFDYLSWNILKEIIIPKTNTLHVIWIHAAFVGEINFGIFMDCPSLAKLFLENKKARLLPSNLRYERYPTVVNFQPYPPLLNLIAIALCFIRLREEDLIHLLKMKNLVCIAYNFEDFEPTVSADIYKKLIHMRSLDSINMVPPQGVWNLSMEQMQALNLIDLQGFSDL